MRQSVAELTQGGIFRGGGSLSDTCGYPFGYQWIRVWQEAIAT
jgi:hypothetical protein